MAAVHAVLLDVRFVLLQTVYSTMHCVETEFLRSVNLNGMKSGVCKEYRTYICCKTR